MFSFFRYLRNITPEFASPIWHIFGKFYRLLISLFNINFCVNQKISKYGPFKIHCFFAFSNFKNWGNEKNSTFNLMINKCKNKKCIIDIGAHIGLMTLPLSSVAKSSKIISFEPSNINRNFLRFHLIKNKITNVEVIDKLVGIKDANNVLFYESSVPTGMNSIIKLKNKNVLNKKLKKQTSLDNFFKDKKYNPDLLKIDAEGSEFFILKGALKTIKKYKPDIFLSLHKKHFDILKIKSNQLFEILKKMNYKIEDASGNIPKSLKSGEYYLHSN